MSASLARNTLALVARLSISVSGTFFHGRFGGFTRTPRLTSIGPGAAIAILVTFWLPRRRSISGAAQSTRPWGVFNDGDLVFTLATRFPFAPASGPPTRVPPESIP